MTIDVSAGPVAVYASALQQGVDTLHPLTPAAALLAYAGAFCARDAGFIAGLASPTALVEVPLLKPNRLHGAREIGAGHAAIFETVAAARFDIEAPVEAGDHAIATGTLAITRADASHERHDIGLVSELRDGRLQRLSLYFNARRVRLWSDRAIL
jgi:hypothetical protein